MDILTQTVNTSSISINKTLTSTYKLLSATLFFSALMAYVSMALNLPHFGILITLGGYFGLLYLTNKLRNSAGGLISVFALTGFMGLTLGPMLNAYLGHFTNGGQLIAMAMVSTGIIFASLSFYVIVTKKDFSFLSGFLTAGIIVAFIAGIAGYFLQMPTLSLVVSSMFVLLMAGLILYQTSDIINGGETNYIMATVTLYISIFNLFVSLLHILGIFSGDD